MFPQPIYGTSSHQIITLNEAIKNAQQRINSQVLLIPSYCSSFFPSPSQFIPLQSHIGNHFLNKDLLPLIPPISSWTTLLKNNINNLNNDEALVQQGENLKENPHYLIQTTSISNKSNDNCLKVGGVSEDRQVFMNYRIIFM
uniref:Uncharacterized protein n=1 Tax=Meloidogyne hapla TaxID=6305 RepID=A0A1I8BPB1_MELHA